MFHSNLDLSNFYSKNFNKIYNNSKLRNNILNFGKNLHIQVLPNKRKDSLYKIFHTYLEEAEITISMLEEKKIDSKTSILEIGGGIGLVYCYLKAMGYKITSLEPSESGFVNYYQTGKLLLDALGVDNSGWHSLKAENANKLKIKFDIIVSHNVLEHVTNLPAVFSALNKVMKSNGTSIHTTVNYVIPYEPHLRIFLIPFYPKLTSFFLPYLRKSNIWKGLHFITSNEIKNVARANKLSVSFENIIMQYLKRLETDRGFRARHKQFMTLYKFLILTGLINLLKFFPATLSTPIRFTLRHRKS